MTSSSSDKSNCRYNLWPVEFFIVCNVYSLQEFFLYDVIFQVIVNLRFTEAARGVNKDINVNVVDTCPKCQGSRCEPGTKAIKCTYCNGSGMETFSRGKSNKYGYIAMQHSGRQGLFSDTWILFCLFQVHLWCVPHVGTVMAPGCWLNSLVLSVRAKGSQ